MRVPPLRDIHSEKDTRRLALDRAGVKGLRYPICVLDRQQGLQHTIAEIDISVSVPHRRRGAHMSRFVELLNRHHREIDIRKFRSLCAELRKDHDAEAAHVEVRFPYFIEKKAPVTSATGLVDYACTFGASVTKKACEIWVAVDVPVTSLCPCSKAISDHGAHNQRSLVSVRVWFAKFFWLEDLIALIEDSASSELYALLKRPDEKFVTERAYERPRFVEDLVREVGTRLKSDANFARWEVEAESFESIHAHSAYATLKHP
ncbi:MAG: GTP cyclohydrolase FolE2 [Myxococcales bacterium]|nr:GTP cyclohydrolase FolE2 [Myxococcales bacterium]